MKIVRENLGDLGYDEGYTSIPVVSLVSSAWPTDQDYPNGLSISVFGIVYQNLLTQYVCEGDYDYNKFVNKVLETMRNFQKEPLTIDKFSDLDTISIKPITRKYVSFYGKEYSDILKKITYQTYNILDLRINGWKSREQAIEKLNLHVPHLFPIPGKNVAQSFIDSISANSYLRQLVSFNFNCLIDDVLIFGKLLKTAKAKDIKVWQNTDKNLANLVGKLGSIPLEQGYVPWDKQEVYECEARSKLSRHKVHVWHGNSSTA